jgi:hypothetical protein
MVVKSVLNEIRVLGETDDSDRSKTGPCIRVGPPELRGEAGERAKRAKIRDQQARFGGHLGQDVEEPVVALLRGGHHAGRRRIALFALALCSLALPLPPAHRA